MVFNESLLEILACPVTKGKLIHDKAKNRLVSTSSKLAYPINDGIPVLLENEAKTLTSQEIEEIKSV